MLDDDGDAPDGSPELERSIRALLSDQPYAVLCTRLGEQPYASLMAFAASEDLREIGFATPVTTRKYRFLGQADRVALLIDDRSRRQDMMGVQSLTVTGRARELKPGAEAERWAARLSERHPYLADFARSPSCALFVVEVVRGFYCVRFQEVRVWRPATSSR